MNREAVELRVGGRTYRVVASTAEDELHRLAGIVDDKLRDLGPGHALNPQSVVLVAIALAHELEEERRRREDVERRSKEALQSLLRRVDDALTLATEEESPSPELEQHPT